jgi:hypothetical protein
MVARYSLLLAASAIVLVPSVASSAPTQRLYASLTGRAEQPGQGQLNGRGSATVRVNQATQQVCYSVDFRNVPNVTMAHIHRGAPGVAGPPVVTLHRSSPRAFQGCARVGRALARNLVGSPRAFYVNVHNNRFPDGAIRGHLHR